MRFCEISFFYLFFFSACIFVYNSRESLHYIKSSLRATSDNESILQELPLVIVQAYNKDLSEKEQVILQERGQDIARRYNKIVSSPIVYYDISTFPWGILTLKLTFPQLKLIIKT